MKLIVQKPQLYIYTNKKKTEKERQIPDEYIGDIFPSVFRRVCLLQLVHSRRKKNKTMNPLFDSYSSEFLQRLKLPVQSRGGFKE